MANTAEEKRRQMAMQRKKKETIERAVTNAVLSLKKMGLESADVVVDNNVAYIMFKVEDVVKLIQKKTSKAVKKVAGNTCEVACYEEDEIIVVRVRKGNA